MKKPLALCVCSVFLLLAGCSSHEAINAETFVTYMEQKGYTAIDELADETVDGVDEAWVVLTDDMELHYAAYTTEDHAQTVFNQSKAVFESLKGNVSSHSSVNTSAYGYYFLTSVDRCYAVSRVGNTVVSGTSSKDSRDELSEIIKELGY